MNDTAVHFYPIDLFSPFVFLFELFNLSFKFFDFGIRITMLSGSRDLLDSTRSENGKKFVHIELLNIKQPFKLVA